MLLGCTLPPCSSAHGFRPIRRQMRSVQLLAYVDPGVGATVMQLVLAGAVGIGALIKLRWDKVKSLFSRDADEEAVETSSDP